MTFDDEDMERRLANWARWVLCTRSGGRVASVTLGQAVVRGSGGGWDAPNVIRTDDAEAEETQAGIDRLQSPLGESLAAWYLCTGGVAQRCALAACSETTLRQRVRQAQRVLGQWLAGRRSVARMERERVEMLQRRAVTR